VLVLTTSNVTGQIDLAFLDRADITQYIQNPNQEAIYTIYRDCIMELMKVKVAKEVVYFILLYKLLVIL